MATTTEEWIEVHSPYNGEVVGRAPKSGADDARRAVDAAARALESPLPQDDDGAIAGVVGEDPSGAAGRVGGVAHGHEENRAEDDPRDVESGKAPGPAHLPIITTP
jgi:hypothetical protein